MIRKTILLLLTTATSSAFYGQNLLAIPDTLSGTNFNLHIIDSTKTFYAGYTTNTYGINTNYLGPTLILKQGDSVSMHVYNELMDTTTIHWHGLHVAPHNDGGPNIFILPGSSWNPQFKVRDHASTYWYHPHLHMKTNLHATLGAAGVIIVRDSIESTLALPRRYGIDDFPVVIQSKCFDASKQILINNASDSVMMVNGTLNAYLPAPAQIVRFRLLNASSERVYNIGFQGNLTFQQIGSDGGLLNAPVALTRLKLAPGERAEILLDLNGKDGQIINLMSYASELPNGTYGATQPGMSPVQTIPGYTANVLNGSNFNILALHVTLPTSAPITTIPSTLVTNTPWPTGSAAGFKTLTLSPSVMGPTALQSPFLINGAGFDMDIINYSIAKDNIEIWTINNQSPIAHPFHIHDVQFYVTEINGAAPPANQAGRKDVILVPAMQTVKFITKFEDFCDDSIAYMYHCHMLPHEDDGMMGQFVVTCPSGVNIAELESAAQEVLAYPNPTNEQLTIETASIGLINSIEIIDATGKVIEAFQDINTNKLSIQFKHQPSGIYLLKITMNNKILVKKLSLTK